jgi:acetolactate synthase-1/2/3 large subunit
MKLSDIVIQFLENKKIEHVFTVSGGGCIHLIDSLGKSNTIKYVCTHHEQAAAIAVEGYFRLSNKLSAAIVTTGPGGTNTLTGVLGCWLDSIPAIFISGQVSSSQLRDETGCRQIGDQEFNIIDSVRPMTKYAVMIKESKDILYELQKAYEIATSGRPGPVWIDIPLDLQGSEVDISNLKQYQEFNINQTIDGHTLDEFKELLENSKKPLIVVGNGIRISNTIKLLDEFINKYKIPVVTGVHSGIDSVNNEYELYCGRIGILGQLTSNKIVQEADLLIVLGSRLNVKMTGYNFKGFSPNSKKIQIDIDSAEINKHKFSIDLPIVADLKVFLQTILEQEYNINIDEWKNFVKENRKEQKYYYPKHEKMRGYVSVYYFMSKFKNYAHSYPIVTSDGTAHVITLQTYNLVKDQICFTNVGCASMGYGLPAAIGACFANNKNSVVCMEGDGSLQMNIQELQTVIHHNLPIKIFVINNEGYLSIKITQETFFNGKEVASGPDSGISFPDLSKISNAYGLKYFCIKNNDEIDSVLNDVFDYNGPLICELFSYPYEKHEPKVVHKGIDKDGKIIPGELTDMHISDAFNL